MESRMRAYELSGPGWEDFKLVERPVPAPGAGEVLVRVRAASLNYRDSLVRKGDYLANPQYPIIPVSDGAGEVVAIGPGVTRLKVADRVTAIYRQTWLDGEPTQFGTDVVGGPLDGLLAEYRVLPESGLVELPKNLSFEEGATLPIAAVTAWFALVEEGPLKAGESVLLMGTGGVSLWGAQFARMFGARPILTTSSEAKVARLQALGFQDIVDYKATPLWEDAVRNLTGGRGVDHVLDVVGGENFTKAVSLVRDHGTVHVIGFLDRPETSLNLRQLMARRVRIQGISVGHKRAFEDMNRAIEQNDLHPVIDRVFTFEEADKAYDALLRGAFGKIVIRL